MAVGAALLAMAVPRLEVEIAAQLARPAVLAAEDGHLVPAGELSMAARRLDEVAQGNLSARVHEDAGRAWTMLALYDGVQTSEGQEHLAAAAASLRASVALAPAAPYVWSRLTYAEYARNHLREAAAAWRMSSLTGRFDPELMERRMQSGFALWPYMELDAREEFGRALDTHWRWDAARLARSVERLGMAAVAQRALAGHPDAAADLERRLASRPAR
ncbi:MAG TPA: hypothetical protein VD860_13930 [Azospirillum sp.]|nr:hypothetical protein [Azospirillum sp.]